jgi:hypothetical protein
MAKDDMAPITVSSYRRVLNTFWRPKIRRDAFLAVRYSMLVRIADEALWSKKSYNNVISVLRRAFKFGYHDHPDWHDPTLALKSARIRKKGPRHHRPPSFMSSEPYSVSNSVPGRSRLTIEGPAVARTSLTRKVVSVACPYRRSDPLSRRTRSLENKALRGSHAYRPQPICVRVSTGESAISPVGWQ